MENLNHAVELYLRAAWLTGQDFEDETDMEKGLRGFHKSEDGKSHDYSTMLKRLPKDMQDALKNSGIKGFTLASSAVARYGDSPGMGYGEGLFSEVDLFIRTIRGKLGFENPKNHLEIITKSVSASYPRDREKIETGIKMIVGASKVMSAKERDKRLRQVIEKVLSNNKK